MFCLAFPVFSQGKRLDERLVSWRILLKSGHAAAVIDSCNALLKNKSLAAVETASITSLKASALRQSGQHTAALALHRRALQIRMQVRGPRHEEVGYSHLNVGNCYLEIGLYEEARAALEKSRLVLEQCFAPSDTQLLPVYNSLGEVYRLRRSYRKAGHYWDKVAGITKAHFPAQSDAVAHAELNRALLHTEAGRYDSALWVLETAGTAVQQSGDTLGNHYIRMLNQRAVIQARLGYPTKALPLWQSAMTIGDLTPACSPRLKGELRYNAGLCHLDIGDLQGAEVLLMAALPYYDSEPFNRSRVWNGIGLACRYRGDSERAIACFTEALNANLEYGLDNIPVLDQAGLYQNLGGCYLDQQQYQAAAYYTEKALRLYEGSTEMPARRAACAIQLSDIHLKGDDPVSALKQLNAAQRYVPVGEPGLQFAFSHQMGNYFTARQDYAAALNWRKQALDHLNLKGPAVSHPFLFEAVQAHAALAECYRYLTERGHDSRVWALVSQHVHTAATLLETLKDAYSSESALPEAQHTFSLIFDLGVEAALASGDAVKAWQWSEYFKSNYLQQLSWQALRQADQQRLSAPLAAEQYARRRLAYFRQLQYNRDFNNAPDLPALRRFSPGIEDSVRYWTERCRQLSRPESGLSQQGPDQQISLAALQQELRPDQTILEYHWGKDRIMLFVITRDTFLHLALNAADSLDFMVRQFSRLCRSDPSWQGAEQFDALVRNGTQLYRQLLYTARPWLRNELIIIPDAVLCYLPFEALITKADKRSHRFKQHRYLLHDHQVGYAHAASVWQWLHKKQAQESSKGLLAITPDFSPNRWGLSALRHNRREGIEVRNMWRGDLLTDREANEDNFTGRAGQYRVLLLSTHGLMHNQQPERSYIAFSQPAEAPDADNLLFVPEIYSLQLGAELVVLSACESAGGKAYRGEGIISVARAFQTAGARTVVASLWNVDDKQTPQLMAAFFRLLKTGKPCFEALAEARRSYLQEAAGLKAHPFYWAGFVANGVNHCKVTDAGGSAVSYLVALSGLLAVTLLLWILRKKFKAPNKKRSIQ